MVKCSHAFLIMHVYISNYKNSRIRHKKKNTYWKYKLFSKLSLNKKKKNWVSSVNSD